MRSSFFTLFSLLPLLIAALPFDNRLSDELRTYGYRPQNSGLSYGPREYFSNGADVPQPNGLWLPRSKSLPSSPKHRRDPNHGHSADDDSCRSSHEDSCDSAHEGSGQPAHSGETSGQSAHSDETSGQSAHDSDDGSSGDSNDNPNETNEGLVPIAINVPDPVDDPVHFVLKRYDWHRLFLAARPRSEPNH